MALTTKNLEVSDELEQFAGELPPAEVEGIKPFNSLLSDGTVLRHGERRVVPGQEARTLVASGSAFYPKDGPPTPPPANPRITYPGFLKSSGKRVRATVKPGFWIMGEGGQIHEPGQEYDLPIEALDDRYARVDAPKPRPKPKYRGPTHPVRVLGPQIPGCGILSVALGQQLDFGKDYELPEFEALALIAIGRVKSLKPDLPDPDALALADLLIPTKEKAKHGRVVEIATKMLKGRSS